MNAVASRNIKFLSHCDQGGRGDGVQVMVERGFAYIGHGFSNGITVIDVRDAKNPKTVNFLPCPLNTRAHHLQTATHERFGDLLLAVNGPSVWTMQVSQEAYFTGTSGDALAGQKFTSGLRVYDLTKPETPREIAFLPLGGLGCVSLRGTHAIGAKNLGGLCGGVQVVVLREQLEDVGREG